MSFDEFQRFDSAFPAIVLKIIEEGIIVIPETVHDFSTRGKEKEFATFELLGYSFRINDIYPQALHHEMANVDPLWASQEFQDRIHNAENPGHSYKLDEKWDKMREKNGKFSYTYGERYWKDDQLYKIMQELMKSKNTRQAVVMVWDQHEDIERMGKRRIPCTICHQFLLRDNKLNMITYIRSNDAISMLATDVFLFTRLQIHVATSIGAESGWYQHNCGSLHVYHKNLPKVKEFFGEETEELIDERITEYLAQRE